jgi:dynein heavy chain, axonemal
MACMVLDGERSLQRSELDFFLKGDTSLAGAAKHCAAHAAHWLSQQGWKDMLCLSQLHPVFATLLQHFESPANAAVWKAWYDLEAPEHAVLPGTDGSSGSSSGTGGGASEVAAPLLTPLQKLCVMRCFRPDRVYNAAKGMVSCFACMI